MIMVIMMMESDRKCFFQSPAVLKPPREVTQPFPADNRGVARNLIWVGINCTISNLSWVKETKQPHKKFKVD